jgi:RNA polymerase sporulation-specific sigma factor
VQSGEKDAFNEIIKRFEPLIYSAVERYLNDELFSQSDRDDLYQDATIALYNAVMSYDLKQNDVTFGLYAKICLNNSMNSALRQRKHQLVADNAQISDEMVCLWDDTVEDANLLLKHIYSILSPFEKNVFKLYIHDASHKNIAEVLGKSEKSIDNAVYRIRIKLARKLL